MKFNLLKDTQDQMLRNASEVEAINLNHAGKKSGFWPSSASIAKPEIERGCQFNSIEGSCLRQIYYRMTGQTQTNIPESNMLDIWDIGNAVEDIYKLRFNSLEGYRVVFPNINGDKLRFTNSETGVRGEVDVILQHKASGTKFGVEMKSYYGFWACLEICGYEIAAARHNPIPYIKVDDPRRTRPGFPKISNLLQTCLYLEEFWKDDIKLFKIIYIPRDKGVPAEFDVTLVEHNGLRCAEVNGVIIPWINLEGIHARYQELKRYLDSNQLPPKDFVNEYNNDYIMTNMLPLDMPVWDKVKHMDWREDVMNKSQNARTAKNKQAALTKAQVDIKRDWQCTFCPYLNRCQSDDGKLVAF